MAIGLVPWFDNREGHTSFDELGVGSVEYVGERGDHLKYIEEIPRG